MTIHYTVYLSNPNAHIYKVKLEIKTPSSQGQIVSLPTWIPGSYMIRDFAKNITKINAFCDRGSVNLIKTDKSSWIVNGATKPLTIEYEIYAWDLSVRTAHMDTTHAYFNGTSLFLMPHGFENQMLTVEIVQPDDNKYADWKLTSTLTKKKTNDHGFGLYSAENYDELVDHPVEIGTHSIFDFTVENIKHSVALTGKHRTDTERLKKDLTKICQTHCTMFGELPEMNEYLFLTLITGDGYGGLEHRNSTSLICSRNDLPLATEPDEPGETYRNFLGLCSHEYFHTWNIKRIKPEVFSPYDLTAETYTRQLWAFEGITSYYDDLALVRGGIISITSYLELLGQMITRVIRGKGRLIQSVADSSFDAWTKFYKQDENSINAIVSYYAKGALLALCLDLTIRKHSHDATTLDDVMRYLWLHYGKNNIGVAEGQIEAIASEISGMDLSAFFESYLYGVEELPLSSLLKDFGINYHLRETVSVEDKGGNESTAINPISIGARFIADNVGAKVTQCFTNESAEIAGIAAGDVIISINHLQVNKTNIEKVIGSYAVADTIKVHAFRRDELMEFDVVLQRAELTTCYLTLDEKSNQHISASRSKWLLLN